MKKNQLQYFCLLLSIGSMAYLSFGVPRTEIYLFWLVTGGMFFLYFGQLWLDRSLERNSRFYIISGGLLRAATLFSLPLLSDDYFRFIWDGRLLAGGINPFLQTPREAMDFPKQAGEMGLTPELFEGMNSPDFFTIYPPVLQGIFFLASKSSPDSIWGAIMVMKSFLFLGEMGSLFLLSYLLNAWKLPSKYLAFYAWNPLVVIELVGNIHFEGLMIFFLLAMIYLLERGKAGWSIIPFVLGICTKLLPLMLGPLLIRRLGWGKTILYGLATAALTFLAFLTIFDLETFQHMMTSVELYFANFEFNASVWYIIRESFGHLTKDNLLETAGRYLGLATVIGIFALTFLEKNPDIKNLPKAMLWAFGIYLLFSPIVHPWYVCTLVALASLGKLRFPILWTLLLPLTYFTYRALPYQENLWFVALEYLCVAGFLIYELLLGRKRD
ncbi:MAG: hypothetical protein MRZ79_23790 [Bacteroidia bacterium]|nr:hypothetical protein [Bacteroidia bacterium]